MKHCLTYNPAFEVKKTTTKQTTLLRKHIRLKSDLRLKIVKKL